MQRMKFIGNIKTILVVILGLLVVFSSVGFFSNENEEEVLEEDGTELFADHSAFDLDQEFEVNDQYIFRFSFCHLNRFEAPATKSYSLSVFHKIYLLYSQIIDFH